MPEAPASCTSFMLWARFVVGAASMCKPSAGPPSQLRTQPPPTEGNPDTWLSQASIPQPLRLGMGTAGCKLAWLKATRTHGASRLRYVTMFSPGGAAPGDPARRGRGRASNFRLPLPACPVASRRVSHRPRWFPGRPRVCNLAHLHDDLSLRVPRLKLERPADVHRRRAQLRAGLNGTRLGHMAGDTPTPSANSRPPGEDVSCVQNLGSPGSFPDNCTPPFHELPVQSCAPPAQDF